MSDLSEVPEPGDRGLPDFHQVDVGSLFNFINGLFKINGVNYSLIVPLIIQLIDFVFQGVEIFFLIILFGVGDIIVG